MKGSIKFFNQEKAYGFISSEEKKEYFFHISDFKDFIDKSKLVECVQVEFKSYSSARGLNAKSINILEDFKSVHLGKRLTKGKKSNLNFKGSEEEIKISEKFSQIFGITFSREEKFKKSIYYFNFIQPSETYRESFNMFNEVLMLFSPFNLYDERTMDYVDKLFMDYSNRLDPVVIFLISKDRNIQEIIKTNNVPNNDTRIVVPFTYNEILSEQFEEKVLQSRLREYFYQRDLFAMESPLKSDNYFYGRTNIVHNFFDKYSIGEQTGLFGLRKTGKTSVLYAVERLVDIRKGMSIFIDCQDTAVYQLRWFELLEYITFLIDEKYELNLIKSKVIVNDEKNASRNFVGFLKKVYSLHNKRVLIILDEIENITFDLSRKSHWKSGEDYLSFWQTLRSIMQSEPNLCSFIMAGVNPKITEQVSVNGFDNPIFNNVSVKYLNLFTLEDVKNMVQQIGSYMGLSFDEKVYYKLHENYGGHPFLIRNVCSMLNSHFIQRPYKINSRDYDDLKDEIDGKLISYIQSILFVLEKWYPIEFEILKDIALENIESYKEKIRGNELSIIHLLGYGVITQSSKNNYYIEIDAIKNYMKSSYYNDYIPADQEEFREIISSRRNKIEKELRNLVKQILIFQYGKNKVNDMIEKHNRGINVETILSRRSSKDVFEGLYFSELKNIVIGEFNIFKNNINIDKAIFIAAANAINKYRYVDAHAGTISREEYNTLHLYFSELENVLEIN
ncbi:cold-shock protein [Clostridium butyricum]|uniref:cold-shock protein n=1 Tax=Clostridium butyricum TaxID=1492 RepID=UPI001969AA2A|nr:cold shock domain-containing protein [Clostridium butyricum]MCQ2022870.1 cold shock domain-containing protein [Clostridium butyricum]MDU1004885.1 cold shock domain-containing protein [Clostridium butyricum]